MKSGNEGQPTMYKQHSHGQHHQQVQPLVESSQIAPLAVLNMPINAGGGDQSTQFPYNQLQQSFTVRSSGAGAGVPVGMQSAQAAFLGQHAQHQSAVKR